MANEATVLIRILAEIRDAQNKIQTLKKTVLDLGDALDKNARGKIEIEVETALTRLKELQKQAEAIQRAGTKPVKFNLDTDEAIKEIQALGKAAEEGMRRVGLAAASKDTFRGLQTSAHEASLNLTKEFTKIQADAQRAFAALNKASQAANFDPLSKSALRLRDNVRVSAQAVVDFANRVPTPLRIAGTGFDKVAEAARKAEITLRAFPVQEIKAGFDQIGASANKAGAAVDGLKNPAAALGQSLNALVGTVRLFLSSLIVRQVIDFGQSVVDAAVRMETLQTKFAALTGSAEGGKQALADVREIADRLGLNFESLAQNFGTFKAAADSVGLSAQETKDIFEGVAVAARGLGLSTDDTAGVLRAFQQSLSKGKLLSEELSQQLGDRLPGAVGRLAKALNVSQAELFKMLETGGALATKTIPALTASFVEAFGPSAQAQSEKTAANIERLKNAFFDAEVAIGQRMLPAVNELIDKLKAVGKDGKTGIDQVGDAMSALIVKTGQLVDILRDLFGGNLKGLAADLAGTIVNTLGQSVEILTRLIGGLVGLFSKDLGDAISKMADLSVANFKKVTDALKDVAEKSRGHFGDVTKAGTDSADEISRKNKELADRLKGYADQASGDQADAYKKAREAAEKEAKKTEDAYKRLVSSVQSLFANLKPDAASVDAPRLGAAQSIVNPDDSKRLDELRAKLEELKTAKQELFDKPSLSEDEQQAYFKLSVEITALEQKIRALPSATGQANAGLSEAARTAEFLGTNFKEAGKGIETFLADFLRNNEQFKTAFGELDAASRKNVEGLVNNLQAAARAGTASQLTLQNFGQSVAGIFANAGGKAAEFASQMAAAFGGTQKPVGDLATELGKLGTELDTLKGKAGAVPASLSPIVRNILELEGGAITAEGAQRKFGVSLDDIRTKLDAQGIAYNVTARDANGLATAISVTGSAAAGVAPILNSHGETIATIGTKAATAGGQISDLKGKVIEIGKEASTTGFVIKNELTGELIKVGEKKVPADVAKSVEDVGKAGTEAGKGLDTAKTAADTAKGPLDAVATAAERIASAKIPEGTGTALKDMGAAATEAKAGVEPLAPAVSTLSTATGNLKTGADGAATALDAIKGAIERLQALLSDATLGTLLSTLGENLTTFSGPAGAAGTALTAIGGAFETIAKNADTVKTAITDVGTSIKEQVESGALKEYASGFESLATATSGVATDLTAIGTALKDFSGQAEPTKAAVDKLQTAFNGLDLDKVKTGLQDVSKFADSLQIALGKGAENGDKAATAIENLGKALETSKEAFKTFAEETVPKIVAVLLEKLEPAFGRIVEKVEKVRDKAVEFSNVFVAFNDTVFPAIETTITKLGALIDKMEVARRKAEELKGALAGLDPGTI